MTYYRAVNKGKRYGTRKAKEIVVKSRQRVMQLYANLQMYDNVI